MNKIKVLVVDDSVFMRTTLTKVLNSPDIEVISTARNGREGVEKVIKLSPDVVTMDIEMPEMTGLEALAAIMRSKPVPVIMISSLTTEGAESTLKAMELGAVDFVTKKPAFTEMYALKQELQSKVKAVAGIRLLRKKHELVRPGKSTIAGKAKNISELLEKKKKYRQAVSSLSPRERPSKYDIEVIGIGISTGGPVALQEVFRHLPAELPVSILIAQHMPGFFTKSFSKRLDSLSQIKVTEAETGDRLSPGRAFVAPGGKHLKVTRDYTLKVTSEPEDELFKPSANVLMESIADVFGKKALGMIMTGMGKDGLNGIKKLRARGAYIMAQDKETCVVSGMVSAIIDAGLVDEIHSLEDIALAISSIFNLETV